MAGKTALKAKWRHLADLPHSGARHPHHGTPLPYAPSNDIRQEKYWPPVGRVDSLFGDKNLVCTCPTTESYNQEAA